MLAKRPLALLVATATAVAVAAPALADSTALVGVTYTTADGTRQFSVTKIDGVTPLTSFTFDSDLAQPFRTTVKDQNRLLNSDGYQVNASMTDLYLKNGAVHDFATYIPSSALSLTYGANPLTGVATLPVSPKVVLSGLAGVLGTCADASVASVLGITQLTSPLDVLGLAALTAPLADVCTQLAAVASTPISTVVTATSQVLDTALSLANLPFALTGALQGGTFSNPSYAGPIASLDPAHTGAPAATTKRIMTGTSLLATGADLSGLLGTLTTALHAQLDGLPAVGPTAKVTLNQAETALSSVQPLLANALAGLPTAQATSLINKLTATVQSVTGLDLSSTTGQYDAYPVLTAAPVAPKAGTYDGTMVVDFIETGA